jgi:hypothetical protein
MSKRKRNRAQKNQRILDLHGIRHHEVDRIVENFIFLTEYPHEIITGNSADMHRIVKDVLDRNGFLYEIGDIKNKGYIKVLGHE